MSHRKRATKLISASFKAVGGFRGAAKLGKRAFDYYNEQKRAAPQRSQMPKRRRLNSKRRLNARTRKRRVRTRKDLKLVKRLQRKVDKLCLTTIMGKHTHRQRRAVYLHADVKSAARTEYNDGGTLAEIEDAMASLRYFDPGTNSMVVANPGYGGYKREMCVEIYRKILVRNNYHVPCYVTVWSCVPKGDTMNGPLALYTSGLADQVSGTADTASQLHYLTDSMDLTSQWVLKSTKRFLQPGQQFTVRSLTPEFKYEFGSADESSVNQYQRTQGGHCWVVRVAGSVAHDAITLNVVSTAQAAVDIVRSTTYTFRYDAGKSVVDYSLDDNTTATFGASGANTSNQPLAGQQKYQI